MSKILQRALFLGLFFLFFTGTVLADDDFKIIYNVNYILKEEQNDLRAEADFQIKIINLHSDVYIKKFSLSFPKSFSIHNLVVKDDKGEVNPVLKSDALKTKIEMEFNQPSIGKATQNNFYLHYAQDNLFKKTGNIYEMILPVIENRGNADYKITVTLPANFSKKISLAKPQPNSISGNQIVWENPTTKTIYGIFGDKQIYHAQLTYNIKNPNFNFAYTDIALPPDTIFQKIYLHSLNPLPNKVFLDEDGNYLARYNFKPGEIKKVVLDADIEVYITARMEVRNYFNSLLPAQSKYLLNQNHYWKITSLDKIASLKGFSDIYNYVVENLEYNYAKVEEKNQRLGAENVLTNPSSAVCMEFSDLTVAIAREKGIYAREIQGYAFSQESELRPISLLSDVLHSWVEYYDQTKKMWIAVDPTWEETSGIDYYHSFDLNHVAFVIHSKDDDYPLPAGMYKIDNSRDIVIQPSSNLPLEKVNISLAALNFPQQVSDRRSYKTKLTVENKSNIFLYALPLHIRSQKLNFVYPDTIPVLAPLQKKEIELVYQAKVGNQPIGDKIEIFLQGNKVFEQEIKIVPYIYAITLKIIEITIGLALIILLLRFLKKK